MHHRPGTLVIVGTSFALGLGSCSAADDSGGIVANGGDVAFSPGHGVVLDEGEASERPTPPEPSDEGEILINPFVMAEHDPQSTFAADVDTASYDMFRRDALDGRLPSARDVRVEEWINYFDYDYPAPKATAEEPFAIALAAGPSLTGNDTLMLRIGVQGRVASEEEKKPTNLVYLIDTSGSMSSPDKLPLVQLTLTESLEVLDPEDTISIVTYAGSTRVALKPTPVAERDAIEDAMAHLTAGGSTAGAAGLDLAYDQAEAGFVEGGINHVVLCTDGDFNVGPSSTDELVRLIETKRESGITLTALGFGENNDAMMERVSNAGDGIYGIIINEDHAIEYVHEKLLSSLVHIAKDVKLQVEFNPELVAAYRLIGYENRAIADEDFRDDRVDAGEIGAGHRVTALYELVPADGQVPSPEGAPEPRRGDAFEGELEVGPGELVLVKIRYKEPGAAADDEAREVTRALGPAAVAASTDALDSDVVWATAVAAYAEIVRGNPYVSPEQLDVLADLMDDPAFEADADRKEFITLFEATRERL